MRECYPALMIPISDDERTPFSRVVSIKTDAAECDYLISVDWLGESLTFAVPFGSPAGREISAMFQPKITITNRTYSLSLEDAVAILSQSVHNGRRDWFAHEDGAVAGNNTFDAAANLTGFEAIAVAEKYLRGIAKAEG